jgi:hypothetical protein
MATFKCNSCGGVYSETQRDGSTYFHVCADVVVAEQKADAEGRVIKRAVYGQRDNARNENYMPGLRFVDGAPMMETPDPETPSRMILTPAPRIIVSEGAGRTVVEA